MIHRDNRAKTWFETFFSSSGNFLGKSTIDLPRITLSPPNKIKISKSAPIATKVKTIGLLCNWSEKASIVLSIAHYHM